MFQRSRESRLAVPHPRALNPLSPSLSPVFTSFCPSRPHSAPLFHLVFAPCASLIGFTGLLLLLRLLDPGPAPTGHSSLFTPMRRLTGLRITSCSLLTSPIHSQFADWDGQSGSMVGMAHPAEPQHGDCVFCFWRSLAGFSKRSAVAERAGITYLKGRRTRLLTGRCS